MIDCQKLVSRRSAIQLLTAAALAQKAMADVTPGSGFRIGSTDWSIGHKQDPGAFTTAKRIGLEGVQVSFSTPGSDFDLREPGVREQYYEQVEKTGVRIASLGMGVLNQKPLATTPEAIGWVDDAIDVMVKMRDEQADKSTHICLLAFFGKGDINGSPELMDSVITKLKTVAEKAEDSGVVFGIESLLSADDHLKIIDGVGSEAIQVYYDSANSHRMGYDIYEEVVQIGGERICQVHCKENGALLGEGEVDFAKFRDALKTAGYRDWLILEGGMPKGAEVIEAYRKNRVLLEKTFRT